MSRSPKFDIGSATAPILAEAIERLELALIPVCPEPAPGPAHTAAVQAHARACLGVDEEFHSLLAGLHETSARGSRVTLH